MNKENKNNRKIINRFKLIFVVGILVLFQVLIYFVTKLFQKAPTMLDTSFDRALPYVSQFVYIYIIWYFMLFAVPWLLNKYDRTSLYKYVSTYIISIPIVGIIFILFPTGIIRPEITEGGLSNVLVKLIYSMDTPAVNCLPSIHCLLAFMFMFSTVNNKKIPAIYRIITNILSILVVLSTLLIKQHVIYDAVVSLLIISIVWLAICRFGNGLMNFIKKIYEKEI